MAGMMRKTIRKKRYNIEKIIKSKINVDNRNLKNPTFTQSY